MALLARCSDPACCLSVYIMDQDCLASMPMRYLQLIYQQPPHHTTVMEETEFQPTLGYRSTSNYHAAMTRRDPYYVRKGWVDDDRHVRVVQSSLKIMQSMDDVYDSDTTTADDVVTEMYTYPAPSEDASDLKPKDTFTWAGWLTLSTQCHRRRFRGRGHHR